MAQMFSSKIYGSPFPYFYVIIWVKLKICVTSVVKFIGILVPHDPSAGQKRNLGNIETKSRFWCYFSQYQPDDPDQKWSKLLWQLSNTISDLRKKRNYFTSLNFDYVKTTLLISLSKCIDGFQLRHAWHISYTHSYVSGRIWSESTRLSTYWIFRYKRRHFLIDLKWNIVQFRPKNAFFCIWKSNIDNRVDSHQILPLTYQWVHNVCHGCLSWKPSIHFDREISSDVLKKLKFRLVK
jgi:hypothetical protein